MSRDFLSISLLTGVSSPPLPLYIIPHHPPVFSFFIYFLFFSVIPFFSLACFLACSIDCQIDHLICKTCATRATHWISKCNFRNRQTVGWAYAEGDDASTCGNETLPHSAEMACDHVAWWSGKCFTPRANTNTNANIHL